MDALSPPPPLQVPHNGSHPTQIMNETGRAHGFKLNPNPQTPATQFIDNALVKPIYTGEPLYYLFDQADPDAYRATIDPTRPKTNALKKNLGFDEHYGIKSLMFYDVQTKAPCCVLMHGDLTVNTRAAAKVLGFKNIQQMPVDMANELSNYRVGGLSGFGLKTPMPIIIQSTILDLDWVIINGGGHYRYLLIRPEYWLDIFSSQYSKQLGFSVHVGAVGKLRVPRFRSDQGAEGEDGVQEGGKIDNEKRDQSIPELKTEASSNNIAIASANGPKGGIKHESNITQYNALVQIQQELLLIVNAYDQNNITNPTILSNTAPRDHLVLLQPSHYISKLLQVENGVSRLDSSSLTSSSTLLPQNTTIPGPLIASQPNIIMHHWAPITIPIFSGKGSTNGSPTSPGSHHADLKTILLKFECTIPNGSNPYPFYPLTNISLSCENLTEFPSLFDVDAFVTQLEQFSRTAADTGQPHLLSLIEFIHENHSTFLRQSQSTLRQPLASPQPPTQSSITFGSLDPSPHSAQLSNPTSTSVYISPLQQQVHEQHDNQQSKSTIDQLNLHHPHFFIKSHLPLQTLSPPTLIDAVEFCVEHIITTVHPLQVWRFFLNGTFDLGVIDSDMTPEQRFAIYHTPLLGRLVRTGARTKHYEQLTQEYNKLKDGIDTTIPASIASQTAINQQLQYDSSLTIQTLIRNAYHDLIIPKITALKLIGDDTSGIVQISSAAKHVNLEQGEQTSFIQKKHGSVRIGLVGTTNCGKSSLYNLISSLHVPASNLLFCTIEPNLCRLPVVDARLQNLVKYTKKALSRNLPPNQTLPVLPPDITVVDIAGIVAKASIGKGLGNAFLHHISTVHVIFNVVRCFDDIMDNSIEHIENSVNPIRDIEMINQELLDKDLEQFYRRISRMNILGRVSRWANATDQEQKDFELSVLLKAHSWLLIVNKPLRYCSWTERESAFLATLQTWTSKPVCFVLNMSIYQYCDTTRRDNMVKTLTDYFKLQGIADIVVTPLCVLYEQARLVYYKRFVPFIGHRLSGLEQFKESKELFSPLSPSFDQIDDQVVVPDTTTNDANQMYTIAAIGREIQANRLDFQISLETIVPKHRSLAFSQNVVQAIITNDGKEGHHGKDKKSDKKDKKDKKSDKKESKSSSSSSSSSKSKRSTTTSTMFDSRLDLGGGFADFLGEPLPSQTSSKKHQNHSNKDSSKVGTMTNEPPSTLSSASDTTLEQQISGLSLSTNIPSTSADEKKTDTKSSKDKSDPLYAASLSHNSSAFWTRVNEFLHSRPRLHSILKQAVFDEDNNEPIVLPNKDTLISSGNTDNNSEIDTNGGDEEFKLECDVDDNDVHTTSSQKERSSNETNNSESTDLLNQVKGKILFLDLQNPTPLAQLIVNACQLARVIQFFIANTDNIRGVMIPSNTTALSAAVRLSRELYDNFHSCEVIHYSDFITSGYSLPKVRDSGKLNTRNKNYIVEDGDIITFKRAKQTAGGKSSIQAVAGMGDGNESLHQEAKKGSDGKKDAKKKH